MGTYSLYDIIEVTFRTKYTSKPPDNPVTIGNKPGALRWASFQDIQDMPNVFEREFRFAYTHAEAEQGGLRARPCILGAINREALLGPRSRWSNLDD